MNDTLSANNTTSNDIEKIASDVVSTGMFWLFVLNLVLVVALYLAFKTFVSPIAAETFMVVVYSIAVKRMHDYMKPELEDKLKAYVKQKNLMKYLDGGKADEESNKEDIGTTSDEG